MPPSRWSRDPLFEPATIFVAASDFQDFWETDPRTLMAILGGPNPFFIIRPTHAVWAPRGPEASRGLWGPLLGPLAASFGDLRRPLLGPLLSSLFSLPSSLFPLPSCLLSSLFSFSHLSSLICLLSYLFALSSLLTLSSWSCEASIP